jgi:hypothetical protein
LPANWLAEIKAENAPPNNLAAENYSAFMSAYLLHERLLLRWTTKNISGDSNVPVKLDDSLAIHCITCCGPACKIWRMSIRKKETSSNLEPVRYDMRLLDDFDIGVEDDAYQKLCDWINALNALALTAQFEGIVADLKEIKANAISRSTQPSGTYSWTSKIGFVYKTGSDTEICAAPLSEIQEAYTKGAIQSERPIGDKIVDGWNEIGEALEVDSTRPKVRQASANVLGTSEHTGRGEQVSGPSVSLALPPTGKVWTAKFEDTELNRLNAEALRRIARALSAALNSGENIGSEGEDVDLSGEDGSAEEDVIGSTKKEHVKYIISAQQELIAKNVSVDLLKVWKNMRFTMADLRRNLHSETLRAICEDIVPEELESNPSKATMVERSHC